MKKLFFILFILFSCSQDKKTEKYQIDITASAGGTVDVKSGKYESGEVLSITATPNTGFLFTGWSNGLIDNPLEITVESDLSITANFKIDCESRKVQTIKLNQPSYFTGVFYELGSSSVDKIIDSGDNCYQSYLVEQIMVDYNRDGYLDMLYAPNEYNNRDDRQNIQFYLGECNGNLTPDEKNNNRFLGLVHARKILVGDYNGDTYLDILLVGHGWDHDDFPGEYPVFLYGSANGIFSEKRLTSLVGYFHGGTSGDFDNDGDLDIILNTTRIGDTQFTYLVNDGSGNFSVNNNLGVYISPYVGDFVNSEFYDINKDGNLDLFLMNGNEIDNVDSISGRNYYSELLVGNGEDFSGSRINIPRVTESTSVSPFYTVYDIDFFDLDGDGVSEVITLRTTENYRGWYIQIVKFQNNTLIDVTDTFIDNNRSPSDTEHFITYIEIREIDGNVILRTGRGKNCIGNDVNFYSWKLVNKKLIRQ